MGMNKAAGTGSMISKISEEFLCGNRNIAVWVIWKYAPDILSDEKIETYADLQNFYSTLKNTSELNANKWAYRPDVQEATKYLLKRTEVKREVDLMQAFYTKAMMKGDTKALDGYLKIKEAIFKGESAEKNLVQEAIKKAQLKVDKEAVNKISMEFGDDVDE